jgi:predicted alpha/beta-hydrolase family hydrolase
MTEEIPTQTTNEDRPPTAIEKIDNEILSWRRHVNESATDAYLVAVGVSLGLRIAKLIIEEETH